MATRASRYDEDSNNSDDNEMAAACSDGDDDDEMCQKSTVSHLTRAQLMAVRDGTGNGNTQTRDPRRMPNDKNSIYYKSYGVSRTGMMPGQSVLRNLGEHQDDIRGEIRSGTLKPTQNRWFSGNVEEVDAEELMRIFYSQTNREERTKVLAMQTSKPDIRFIRIVAGFVQKPVERLFEVVGDEMNTSAIEFVKSVKKWANRTIEVLTENCYSGRATIYKTRVDGALGAGYGRDGVPEVVLNRIDAREGMAALAFLTRYITTLNKDKLLKDFRDFVMEPGKYHIANVSFSEVLALLQVKTIDIKTFIEGNQLSNRFPNLHTLLHVLSRQVQDGHKVVQLIDVICNGTVITKGTAEPYIVTLFGEGTSVVLAKEISTLYELLMGGGDEKNFHTLCSCYDVDSECDKILSEIIRDRVKTYEQFDRIVLGPLVDVLNNIVSADHIKTLYTDLRNVMEAVKKCDIIMSSEVVAAGDCAYGRVMSCCPSVRKHITKTGLMQDDGVYIIFAELTALIMIQYQSAKSYHQEYMLKTVKSRIESLENDFALKLRWNQSKSMLEF
jgi:hypothetical protein